MIMSIALPFARLYRPSRLRRSLLSVSLPIARNLAVVETAQHHRVFVPLVRYGLSPRALLPSNQAASTPYNSSDLFWKNGNVESNSREPELDFIKVKRSRVLGGLTIMIYLPDPCPTPGPFGARAR